MPKAKQQKKSKKTKASSSKGSDGKVEAFVNSLQLNEMWEEFHNAFNSNGTPRYKTVWSFISKYTKVEKHRDILYWMLGPKVVIKPGEVAKYNLDQYDWEDKRQRGYWFLDQNVQNLKQDIHAKAIAYQAIKEAGKVNVDTIAMLNKLLMQLEVEFGGRLFLPELSVKENAMRATLYMQLVEKITTISNQAQLMFAKTQGMDLERLDQFFAMFGSAMGRTAATLMGAPQDDSGDNASGHHLTMKTQFAKVLDMVTNKAAEYNLPVPDDIAAAIKATTVEEPAKKKSAKPN